jgi:hypothetical protein
VLVSIGRAVAGAPTHWGTERSADEPLRVSVQIASHWTGQKRVGTPWRVLFDVHPGGDSQACWRSRKDFVGSAGGRGLGFTPPA